jgi:hypothetical protein
VAVPSQAASKKLVYHVDPQAKLIPSDDQWNQKVQRDLQMFRNENEQKKKQTFDKYKAV